MTKDVMVGFPCYDGRAETDTMQTLIMCLHDPESPVGAIQYLHGDSLVTRARNKIVKRFLESKMQFLLFIDSDILFDPKQIIRLRSHDKFIVGGAYLKKKLPYAPVCNSKIGEEGDLDIVREAGTGFLMIHRDVFEDIRTMYPEHSYTNEGDEEKGTYYDWFRVGVKNGRYLSEDYYFCQLAGEAGFNVYYDSAVLVRHVGRAVYPFKDEELLDGASELLNAWNKSVPFPPNVLENLTNALKRHDHHHTDHQHALPAPSPAKRKDQTPHRSGRSTVSAPVTTKPIVVTTT
jgi:hypothetical protein